MARWRLSAIAVFFNLTVLGEWDSLFGIAVRAQVIPDASLGSETSTVTSQGLQDIVTGGAARGAVLLHSFQDLNVAAGRSLYFTNPTGISHIFSRITGSNPSNIDGTVGVLGNADLFLLNPNGVLFGPNAQLDVRGSFTATTAASVQVGGLEFSAVSPAVPPLLNLSVQPGIQLGTVASTSQIRNEGLLAVGGGRSLSLIGGQIEQAGTLLAPGGTVTLQGEGLSLTGSVDTRDSLGQPGTLRLISPVDLQIQPTGSLTNQAINQALLTTGVVVQAAQDLSVAAPITSPGASPLSLMAGRDLTLTQNSDIVLGGNVTLMSGRDTIINAKVLLNGSGPHQLLLQAEGDVRLEQGNLFNDSVGNQQGKPRSQTWIRASNLRLEDAQITAWIYGSGEGPNIQIEVDQSVILKQGTIIAFAPLGSSGDIGDITINARHIRLDGSSGQRSIISTSTDILTPGNAGNITLNASDSIELIGDISGPFNLSDFTAAALVNLALQSTTINSSAFGFGQSGNITIHTGHLVMRDGVAIGLVPGIFATVRGQEGNIAIAAQDIDLQGLAAIGSITLGATDAGDVTIQGDRLTVQDGAFISVNSLGVNTLAGSGDAGELRVDVRELNLRNGSFLGAGTDTSGLGGTLGIDADTITIAGVSADGLLPSALRTDVGTGLGGLDPAIATGRGGQIAVNANHLRVLDGGQIIASTRSRGDAGNVEIRADRIDISGTSASGIPSSIEARSAGAGAAGTLRITGQRLRVAQGAQISTTTERGDGGNIFLDLEDLLLLRDRGLISATAGQAGTGGNGGNIQIQAGFIVAPLGANSDITANAFEGNGGTITIQTQGIFGLNFRPDLTPENDITTSSKFGLNGTVNIDILELDPTRGLAQLPVELGDSSHQIDTSCDRLYQAQSRFVISGRGGLPPDPRQEWSAPGVLQDWREVGAGELSPRRRDWRTAPVQSMGKTVMEATGWQMGPDGKIHLVAEPDPLRTRLGRNVAHCGGFGETTRVGPGRGGDRLVSSRGGSP